MDIYTYAMQMEKDGRKYYLDMAQKTDNPGIKGILKMMADAEAKHYNVLLAMQRNEKAEFETDTEIFTEAKNVFTKMREEGKELDVESSQVEFYKQALAIEKESHKFYLEKAEEEQDQQKKEIILKIASEEKDHCILLSNIIDFISRPDSWLEDAEWHHSDEY
ncbi:MAG: rubrerythrin [Candidatus Scalindua sp. AMX11]|nr:MAG: rubrerythrin [Candidatus Scalindua sp.]NOG84970.1 ferritin family protein [Planctomycetota bacterium]RZV93025.1 MAG: rubrerythrin [Candidatus Scalindua sp. SCAELEC01]TDE66645.1 MAG: rubrerythrin [Candidatus Scalindua sp. AMX11]GJQ57952.1 MAG: rubrerythrin [Candidatus Scalindua sp.]